MSAGTSVAQLAGTYKLTKCPDFTQEKHNAHFCSSCVPFFSCGCFFFLIGLFILVCVSFITIMTFKFHYRDILEGLSLKMNLK